MIYHGLNPQTVTLRSFLSYIQNFEPVMLEAVRRDDMGEEPWWEE